MGHYTERVGARARVARALAGDPERAKAAGVTVAELDVIATKGDEAREADREQAAELASNQVEHSRRGLSAGALIRRGDDLRDRVPAAVRSLAKAGHEEDSNFLAALSYSRFRLRGLPLVDPALANDPDVKKVERVEREDKLTQLQGISNLAATILTREHIVADLAERGFDRAALEQLRDGAAETARAGKNILRAAAATKRESDAVDAQKEVWDVTWRMIRKAVQGDEGLEKLYAQC